VTATDGYLLDTSALSARYDAGHPKHAAVKAFLDGLAPTDLVFVSAVAIAELRYGAALWEAANCHALQKATTVLAGANSYTIRDITQHTGTEYGAIKTKVAFTYLKEPMNKKHRTPWIEDWIDQYTGRVLNINEGDLWMCAQARERNLVLLTTDRKMKRISAADPTVQIKVIA
jgi:predicted nucleic acid-binding protein